MVIQLKAERKKMIKNMEKESKSDKKPNHKMECQMKAYKSLLHILKLDINQDLED